MVGWVPSEYVLARILEDRIKERLLETVEGVHSDVEVETVPPHSIGSVNCPE